MEAERRVMRIVVPARFVVEELRRCVSKERPGYIELSHFDVPPGTTIVAGPIASIGGMCWDLYVHHPTFAEVPEGEEPPCLNARTVRELVALAAPVPVEWLEQRLQGIREELNDSNPSPSAVAPKLAERLNMGVKTWN